MRVSQKVPKVDLPTNRPGRPKKDVYKEQHGVIVLARDELHQKEIYDFLTGHGLSCKVVTT